MINVSDLTYTYKVGSNKPALNNVNINFNRGNLYAILGNNGCGKSTLLKCICGICSNSSVSVFNANDFNNFANLTEDICDDACVDVNKVVKGDARKRQLKAKNQSQDTANIKTHKINICDLKANERAKIISYCPQNCPANNFIVYDFVMLGRKPYINFSPSKQDKNIVLKTLESFDLADKLNTPVNLLSGGEFQRAVIARAFVQDCDVMLLDEPTNNLDVAHQHKLMHSLQHCAKDENKLVICVLHDINMALTHADEIVFIKDGNIEKQCRPNDVDKNLLSSVYSVDAQVIDLDGYKAVFI